MSPDLRTIRAVALLGTVFIAACSSQPFQSPLERQGASSNVAVVPARYAPESNFEAFANRYLGGTTKGAATGAMAGGLGGAAVGIQISISPGAGPFGIIALPFLAAAGLVVGTVAGAVGGAMATVPEKEQASIDNLLRDAVVSLNLSELIAQSVLASPTTTPYRADMVKEAGPTAKSDLPDYRKLDAQGFGAVIEIRAVKLGFVGGGGRDPELALFLLAEARLIDPHTGKTAWLRGLGYQSPDRKSSVWASDNARLVRIEIERAATTLGERIADNLLFASETALISPSAGGIFQPMGCGVMPTVPEPIWDGSVLKFDQRKPLPSRADSLSPLLGWEAFPRENWVRFNPELGRAKDVRYDLRIWRAIDNAPGELVYEKRGLPANEHRVETTLDPGTLYFWSIRPRYSVDGHPRAMRWSASEDPPFIPRYEVITGIYFTKLVDGEPKPEKCPFPSQDNRWFWTPCQCLDFIPPENHYRFLTP